MTEYKFLGIEGSLKYSAENYWDMEGKSELKQLFLYEQKARRLELLIRIVYSIAIWAVLVVYGLIATICLIIQFFYVLIFGRRHEGLSNFIKGYLEYYVHILGYVYIMTDKRPGILPKKVKIYEEETSENI